MVGQLTHHQTINGRMAAVSGFYTYCVEHFYTYCVEQELIDKNLAANVRRLTITRPILGRAGPSGMLLRCSGGRCQ